MEYAQYLEMAELSADKPTSERFFRCWEGMFARVLEFVQNSTDSEEELRRLSQWWNPHVEGSDLLLKELGKAETENETEPAYRVLRWMVAKVRGDYGQRDPSTFILVGFDPYVATVRQLDSDIPNHDLISPLISSVGFYKKILEGATIELN